MKFLSDILAKAGLIVDGTTQLNTITNAVTDTDKFIVSDGGVIKYRTGAQVLNDIDVPLYYVPYTGANQNVNLGEYELKAGQLTLDTSPTGTAAVGTTRWNNAIGSSETTLKGGNVILKNGVDLVARVVNKVTPNTTLTKANYPAVRVSGAQGQRLAVAYAQANNDNNSADTIGLVTETIATNQEGFIMTVGQLEGVNTTGSLQGETWADGDVLYLSPTTPGALTNVKPNGSTGHIVVIGYVEYAHAINGKIYVKIMNGWELDELHNVYISSVANNQGLFYESATDLWKNKSIATVLGYTPADDSLVVHKAGTETITGAKTFTNAVLISANSPELNLNQGTSSASYINFKENSSLVNRIISSGAALTFITNNSGTAALVLTSAQTATFGNIPNATTDTDKFLVSDAGTLKYRTGAELLSDIGGQGALTLTTTGTSGASTLVGNTLNIPQYQAQGNYITSLTGEATASGPGAASVTLSTSAVTGKVLTGLNVTGGTVLATDSILTGFGKLQNQVNGLFGGVTYQGTWDASTNTPTLTSSSGTKGYYYVVSVPGSTNLNGITDWKLGDWAIYNGTSWEKVDNTDAVISVNGFTGAVSLTTTNISEGTNLYYTDARARGAISLTTTGTSGAATYDNVTGVLNIPQYQTALTNPVTGTGTTNYIAKFTSSSAIGNSVIYESGGNIGIGTTTLTARLTVNGNAILGGSINATETYLSSPNGLVFQINSTNVSGGYAEFQTNSTTIGKIGTATQVVGSGGTSVFAISSTGANDFILGTNGTQRVKIDTSGNVTFSQIANATTDTDTFLVADSGVVKYRTGAQLLSDIGGASSSSISGTTNYIPKFTSSSAIGNSIMSESSSNINVAGSVIGNNFYIPSGSAGTYGLADLSAAIQTYSGSVSPTNTIIFYNGGSERMRLTSTGLGIGTSSPTRLLHIDGGASTTYFQMTNTASGSTSGDGFQIAQSGANVDLINRENGYITFNTNNTERMRLDASGNLGLSVTPSAWNNNIKALQVNNSSFASFTSGNNVQNWIALNAYYDNATGWLYRNSSVGAALYAQIYDGSHSWNTAPSGTAGNAISFTQAMTLDASGNLGVGTTTLQNDAGYKTISISGSTGGQIAFQNAGTTKAYIYNSATDLTILNTANGILSLGTNNAERMRITSAGNVGVGTSSPVSTNLTGALTIVKSYNSDTPTSTTAQNYYGNQSSLYLFGRNSGLTIVTNNGENGNIIFANASTSSYATIGTTAGTSSVGGDMYFRVGSDAERMRITSAGNVGIGTSSPQAILSVKGSANNTVIEFENGGATKSFMRSYDRTASAYREYEMLADYLLFSTGSSPSERMRITSAGRVGIGTTTPAAGVQLQVVGGIIGCLDVYNNTTASAANLQIDANGYFARSTSSIKYKTDVRPYDKGLAMVMQLNPVYYKGKNDGNTQFAGLIAEDIHNLGLTEFVQYAKDGSPDAISYQNMVALLAKAIQELKAEIETLKNK